MIDAETSLTKLHDALCIKKLNPGWAKMEIFLGLAAAAGLMVAVRVLSSASVEIDWVRIIVSTALMVFGAYLAMASHRSDLEQVGSGTCSRTSRVSA